MKTQLLALTWAVHVGLCILVAVCAARLYPTHWTFTYSFQISNKIICVFHFACELVQVKYRYLNNCI